MDLQLSNARNAEGAALRRARVISSTRATLRVESENVIVHVFNSTKLDREPKMPFEPKIEGINKSTLIEIKGERGNCYMASVGGMPERLHTFFNGDDTYQFCFYANRKWEGDEFDVEVFEASIYRFHGPRPYVNPDDMEYIRQNTEKFFTTRCFLTFREPIPSTEKLRKVILSWRL
jgi:hypothetical protein